jgi:hypothetical protein
MRNFEQIVTYERGEPLRQYTLHADDAAHCGLEIIVVLCTS